MLSLPWLLHGAPAQPALAWLLAAGLVTPLAWRRRAPTLTFTVVAAVGLLQWALDRPRAADLALLVALYTIASRQSRRRALAAVGVLEIGVLLAAARFSPAGDNALITSVVFLSGLVAAAFFIGTSLQNRRAYLEALVDRAARAERERDQQARLAATEERSRIARELHDVVAHSLTVVVTMSEAAAATTDPPAAQAAMREVAASGRSALTEMRRLLGVLRTESPDPHGPSGAQLAPVPGLDRIDALVARVRDAGLPVRLTVRGGPRPLPATMDATAYRVVQEALTNVLRHAVEVTTVDLVLHWQSEALAIDVRDNGRPHRASSDAGHGLTGMRERLAVFGGELTTGPATGGGWAVEARLPYPEDRP